MNETQNCLDGCLVGRVRYNTRQEVLRRVPGFVGLEVEAAGALPVTENDIRLLHFWGPFADHAYDANVRPWLDTQEGWVLLHQVRDFCCGHCWVLLVFRCTACRG